MEAHIKNILILGISQIIFLFFLLKNIKNGIKDFKDGEILTVSQEKKKVKKTFIAPGKKHIIQNERRLLK